jgi:hypothetical protein
MAYDQEKINKDLTDHNTSESDFQRHVVELCKTHLRQSVHAISSNYLKWDHNDMVYRGYKLNDKNDQVAEQKKEPHKIIVPITYAQIQTAVAFLIAQFSARARFYELVPFGSEDTRAVEALEADLDYQLRRNNFHSVLANFCLDTLKYGIGILKVDWRQEYSSYRVSKPAKPSGFSSMLGKVGIKMPQQNEESVERILSYEGSKIYNVSPYCFYPDPTINIARFQEGQFVAHDEDRSKAFLETYEGNFYYGTKKVPGFIPSDDLRNWTRRTGSAYLQQGAPISERGEGSKQIVVTECQILLNPKQIKEKFDMDIGDEDRPVKFIAVIANNQKLIKFERLGYLHDQFTYVVAESSPDHTAFINGGLSDTIDELQQLITFLLNSHVTNVKKIIQNRLVVDPQKVDLDDIRNNAMLIKLKQSNLPIDRVLYQLQMQDVTSHHIGDLEHIFKLVQLVSGISENALGQYTTGRRSATEARSVQQGAASRSKLLANHLWSTGLEPLGKMLLSNTRQGRSRAVYSAIVGPELEAQAPYDTTILVGEEQISGGYDFAPFDATLPSEKQAQAAVLKELLEPMISNPQLGMMLQLDPVKLLHRVAQLLGIKDLGDLKPEMQNPGSGIDPAMIALLQQQAASKGPEGPSNGPSSPEAAAPSGPPINVKIDARQPAAE